MPRSPALPGRWRGLLLVALLVAAAGLGGCARTLTAAPAAPAEVHSSWPGCDAVGAFDDPYQSAGPPDPGSIPEGFVPTQAVLCGRGERTSAAGAVLQVGLERRAGDIAPLLSYLARPSEVSSRPDDLVCPAMAVTPAWLFLTDADGRWVTPAIPTDACGFPFGTFTPSGPALPELRYRDTVVRQLRVHESAEARRSGCSMQWKNVVAAGEPETRRAAVRTDPFAGAAVRVCRYGVAEEEQASSAPGGELLSGGLLDGRQRRNLVDGLVGSPAAPRGCDERASRFAVLRAAEGGRFLQVELDGCRRILHPSTGGEADALAQAGVTLVRLLDAAGR